MSRGRHLARTKRIQRLRRLEREERRQDCIETVRVLTLSAWSYRASTGTLSTLRRAIADAFEGRALDVSLAESGAGDLRALIVVAPGYGRLGDERVARLTVDAVRPAGVSVTVEIRSAS